PGSFFRSTLKRFVTRSTRSAGIAGAFSGPTPETGVEAAEVVGSRAGSIERSCVIFGSWSIVLGMVVVLLGWRTWKGRDPDPVRGGWLAACRWPPRAARGQTKNRGPHLAHGSWFLRLGGTAAGQLTRGGH